MTIIQKDQLKQAKIVLKKLAVKENRLQVQPPNPGEVLHQYKILSGETVCYQKSLSVKIIEMMAREGWVRSSGLGCQKTYQITYQITGAGKSALRRMLSGGEHYHLQHKSRSAQSRTVDGKKQSVIVCDSDSPLAWLAKRKDKKGHPLISAEALQAGLRLEQDFHYAGLQPKVTAHWSPTSGAGGKSRKHGMKDGAETANHIMAAKDRVRKVSHVLGSEMASVAVDVCCFHLGLEQLERTRGWPKRSGKVVLQLALHRLAQHYGLLAVSEKHSNYRSLSGWGAEDYRPTIKVRPEG